jgi:uroporphyrinogen decarboxylase
MTKRERVREVYALRRAGRVPFVPAIYEHKGALIGRSPSEICRNADYLCAGLQKELEVYDADMLVIGIDVYNVEAEALGCRVVYFEDSNDVPGIVDPLIRDRAGLARLGVPDPERDGRMPIYLEAAARMYASVGHDLILRGAVTGPYSMAAELIGAETFVLLTVEEPDFAREVIEFCARVTVEFGKAFLTRGVDPIIFDSRATPTLASPRVVKTLLMPVYRDYVIPELKAAGGRYLPLIIGGNTTSVIDDLIATGASQFLSDRPANLALWTQKALAAGVPVRANVDAVLVNRGPVSAIREQAMEIMGAYHEHPGFLMGCGVIGYDGNPAHVHAIREVIDEFEQQAAVVSA